MDIEAIRARAEAATPGPWKFGSNCIVTDNDDVLYTYVDRAPDDDECWISCMDIKPEDADFIAHAREDIPDLLAEVERLQERVSQKYDDLVKEFLSKFTDGDLAQQVLDTQAELATVKAEREKAIEENRNIYRAITARCSVEQVHDITSDVLAMRGIEKER